MKTAIYIGGFILMLAASSAYADSILRIKCDDKDVGAEVYINGKFVGNCPVDAPAQEGIVRLRARKIVNGDYEQLFEKDVRVVDGVPQRIEVIMSAPQLTAEGRQRKDAAEANSQLRAAEAGNIAAMQKIAEYYDAGMGVKRDPAKANFWRKNAEVAIARAEAVAAQEDLRAANSGNIEAMDRVAARYDVGRGMIKNEQEASLWREKADAARKENFARELANKQREKERIKQAKIDAVDYFGITNCYINQLKDPHGHKCDEYNLRGKGTLEEIRGGSLSTDYTSLPIGLALYIVTDATEAPTRATQLAKIKREAALRPSTWGNPDSMIARVSRETETQRPTSQEQAIFVASK